MKFMAIAFTFLIASSAFAGSFTKTESGKADWLINTENLKGDVFLTKTSSEISNKDVTSDELKRIHYKYSRSLVIKEASSDKVNYKNIDERSHETVLELLKNRNSAILSGNDIELKNVDINLENIKCRFLGTTNQVVKCQALYFVKSDVDFK